MVVAMVAAQGVAVAIAPVAVAVQAVAAAVVDLAVAAAVTPAEPAQPPRRLQIQT